MKTTRMEFEQIFMLRDTVEATLNTPMFKGDKDYEELYTETDQIISQTNIENIDW